MTTSAKRKPPASRKRKAQSLVRVQVRDAKRDGAIIRDLAEALRNDPARAKALRGEVQKVLNGGTVKTAFDIFGSDLPDHYFDGVFDHPRPLEGRKIDL